MLAYQPTGNPPTAKKLLHRRQQQLHPKSSTSSWHSVSSSSNRNSRLWMVEEAGYENPQKEMDFPSAKLTDKLSRSNLRIDPYAKADLHDRYLSSEEEASPSPEDDHRSTGDDDDFDGEEALSHKKSRTFSIQTSESDKENDIIDLFAGIADSTPSLAIAVPILAVGRPKLIDITNIAPMHKRKRSSSADTKPLHTAHRHSNHNISNNSLARHPTPEHFALDSFPAPSPPTHIPTHPPRHRPSPSPLHRRDSIRLHQPDTWLPASPTTDTAPDGAGEHYFPDHLDVRPTPSYHDYDPYSLDPPRLAPSPGGAGRAKGGKGWRGVTRGFSLGRRIGAGGGGREEGGRASVGS